MRHIVQSLCCLEEEGDSESSKDIKPHSDWVYLCMQLFKEVVLIVDSESSKDIKPHSDWVYLCMQLFKKVFRVKQRHQAPL